MFQGRVAYFPPKHSLSIEALIEVRKTVLGNAKILWRHSGRAAGGGIYRYLLPARDVSKNHAPAQPAHHLPVATRSFAQNMGLYYTKVQAIARLDKRIALLSESEPDSS